MKIVTTHVFPPIPIRNFDWQAIDDETRAWVGFQRNIFVR